MYYISSWYSVIFDINTEGFHRTLIEVAYAPNAFQFSCEYNFLAVNRPMFTIYTVEYFLQVILSVYRFKGIIFVLKTNMHTKCIGVRLIVWNMDGLAEYESGQFRPPKGRARRFFVCPKSKPKSTQYKDK